MERPMIVWIWNAIGPAASACGVADTADAARRCAGSLIASGRAHAARVEPAALVLVDTLFYDYCRPAADGTPGSTRAASPGPRPGGYPK